MGTTVGRILFAIRAGGILTIFLAVTVAPTPASGSGCGDCPEIAGITCVTPTTCESESGGCTSSTVPEGCEGCYVKVCTDWECSGPHGGLQRLECRQIEEM